MPGTAPTIFLSAGEASGEQYGALLLTELKARCAAAGLSARFFGMGGERMQALGLERVVRSEDVAVMGITEVVRHLPRIYREFRKLKTAIAARKPDVAVLIDFPDIHLKLAEELHAQGTRVIFFVSPQLWAWKKGRIQKVQRFVDRMLVIFPFEEPFYRERGVDAEFVGHPMADMPQPSITREDFARRHGLNPAGMWIGLLPGSRAREIKANLPEMLRAAEMLASSLPAPRHAPAIEFVLPLAATLTARQRDAVREMVAEFDGRMEAETARGVGEEGVRVHLVDDARGTLRHARASVVASGTATVEAALIGNPFVVVYRVSPLTYWIAKRVVTVAHVAMVNLIADRRVVPELIQNDFTAENIVQHVVGLLPDGLARSSMMEELTGIRTLLVPARERGAGAIGRVAEIAMAELSKAFSRMP